MWINSRTSLEVDGTLNLLESLWGGLTQPKWQIYMKMLPKACQSYMAPFLKIYCTRAIVTLDLKPLLIINHGF